jgi:hypothetical protein
VLYLRLIILLVRGDVLINNEAFLVIDFVNLKINPAQSFKYAHIAIVCVRVYIHRGECSYMYEYLYLYYVSKIKRR